MFLIDLYSINISYNDLADIQPQVFSSFCTLHEVLINQTQIPMCMCYQVRSYLLQRPVNISGDLQCDSHPPERADKTFYCPETQNVTIESFAYDTCMEIVKAKRQKVRSLWMWIIIVASLTGSIALLMAILYWMHRRSVRQTRRSRKQGMNNETLLMSPI